MTAIDVERVKGGLRQGRSVEDLAEEHGISARHLLRLFRAATGLSIREWSAAERPAAYGESPRVFFRLPEYADLERVAEADGVHPNEWARNAVQRAIKRARKQI